MLDEAGFTATLAANSEFEIERYLHLGELVTTHNAIESISEEKRTRLGPGHFVTWVTTYFDERRRSRRATALPGAQVPAGRSMSVRLAPTVTPDTQFFWEGLQRGSTPDSALCPMRASAPPAETYVPVV